MWDRFHKKKSNYFTQEVPDKNALIERRSFNTIDVQLELVCKQPDLKKQLLEWFDKKLNE